MNCRRVREKLTEYLAGELVPGERAAIAAHLDGCERCRAELAALRRAEDALETLAVVEHPPDLVRDLDQRLAAGATPRLRLAWIGAPLVATAAVAACLLWLSHPAPSPQTAPVESRPIPPRGTVERPEVAAPPRIKEDAEFVASQQPRQAAPQVAQNMHGLSEQTSVVEAAGPPPTDETVPFMAHRVPAEMPRFGVILLLGEPQPILPSFSCYLEVSFPDGAKSILDQSVERDAAGEPRVVQISYAQIAPERGAPNQGG
ncbi:MAG: zf-HC2 domain-containing protein [Armatimonadota bacterium]|nr:MAG: zf-HC2 domain-containing protein [Armatimonadota bacterium]